MKQYWTRFRALSWWKQTLGWIGASFLALFVAGTIAAIVDPPEDDGDDEPTVEAVAPEEAPEPEPEPAPAPEPEPEPAPAPEPEPGPTEDDLQDALDDADPTEFGAVATDLNVKEIERFPAVINLTLETPEGGFEGASVDDLDGSAAAAFKAIYTNTDWQRGATVSFTGGLVDTRTGQDLPNERTGLYRLTAREARQIDWDNADVIDWSLYRLFAHPALKD